MLSKVLEAHDAIPRVLTVVNESESASVQWRVRWPSTELMQRGYVADWILDTNLKSVLPMVRAGRYNVVVMSRLNFEDAREASQWGAFLHEHGAAWIYGVDDHAWGEESLDPQRLSESMRANGKTGIAKARQSRIEDIQRADGVLVSTQALATAAREHTSKPVVVVPNLINAEEFVRNVIRTHRSVRPLTVGWSGSFRPDTDLQLLAGVWSEIAKRYPSVHFVLQGEYAHTLCDAVPSSRLTYIPWASLDDYPALLQNIDIMCCYLPSNSPFCRAKSPIKWFEASLVGCASVVSDVVYGDVVLDGLDALVATSADQWIAHLSTLIENEDARRSLSKHAARDVHEQFSLERNWSQWLDGFTTLKGVRTDGRG